MSEDRKKKAIEDAEKWEVDNGEWIWGLLIFSLFAFGWNNTENPRISKLEKKVARLEGQMPMVGGRLHE